MARVRKIIKQTYPAQPVNAAEENDTILPGRPEPAASAEPRSLTSLREKLIKSSVKVCHPRPLHHLSSWPRVAVLRQMFKDILMLIVRLRAPPAPA